MPSKNTQLHAFENLDIWIHFLAIANEEQASLVKNHLILTLPVLDHYTDTFKDYTLHNRQHQVNIIRLMGELLDDRVKELTALETAMLILSAAYHDIGMAFKESALEKIADEEDFSVFLEQNSSAMLIYKTNNETVNEELIEWYCRWMHAKRVWIFLDGFNEKEPIIWNGIPFKNELGHLCESHNLYVKDIIANLGKYSTNFAGECDMVLCACLLRLADILDFDNTRSPQSVYEFLELDKPKNKLENVSSVEWQKHLSSSGFKFDRSSAETKLLFIAAPRHPNIEMSILAFIRVIETELKETDKLMNYTSHSWRNLKFPNAIDTSNVKSQEYISGNYKLSLSEENIIKLLTGEGIYKDEFIFLRELIQNAIDTTRHRSFVERISNPQYYPEPIIITDFTDSLGYQWIRIDDHGMGMNLDIITKHLLQKGNSYYNSDEFKLAKLEISSKTNEDFKPISRFGIGLLSCFIPGDKIEISTRHSSSKAIPYRLSIEGRTSYYMLQSKEEHHAALIMPAKYSERDAYRSEAGTSIAVRINTNNEYIGFNLKNSLERYVVTSPVPIQYNGNLVGGDFKAITENNWSENQVFEINPKHVQEIEEAFGIQFEDGIKIHRLNINLTEKSLDKNLRGQLFNLILRANHTPVLGSENTIRIRMAYDNNELKLAAFKREKQSGQDRDINLSFPIDHILKNVNIPEKVAQPSPYRKEENIQFQNKMISHNGISIFDEENLLRFSTRFFNQMSSGADHDHHLFSGLFYLQDELLPEVTVSRNEIKSLRFAVTASINFALDELNQFITSESERFSFFQSHQENRWFTRKSIKDSKFYDQNRQFLNNYVKLSTADGLKSVTEILKSGQFPNIWLIPYPNFYSHLVSYIIEENFAVTFLPDPEYTESSQLQLSPKRDKLSDSFENIFPLTVVPFHSLKDKISYGGFININHPYIIWYQNALPTLKKDFTYYSYQLVNLVGRNWHDGTKNSDKINLILERLRQALPQDQRPPISLVIKESELTR